MWSQKRLSGHGLQHWGWAVWPRCRRHGVAAPVAPGAMPVLCFSSACSYAAIGLLGLIGFALPAWASVVVGLDRRLGRPGFCVAAYQTWMQAYPHLAPECSFTDPNAIERLVDWLGMQMPTCSPGNSLLYQLVVGVSWTVDGQLVHAVLCRVSPATQYRCSGAKPGPKQNPPKGGFVECWRKPNYFSFTSL